MKASIKFRDEQKPLLRAKIPLKVLNFPFQSGISAGESKGLSLSLSTFFDSGPSLKFSYHPNDFHNPFSFVFKTGIGNFGSPGKSPLTMSAEFNLIGNQTPSFFIHFKPEFGDFSLRRSHSSGSVKALGEKLDRGIVNGEDFVNVGYLKGNGFLPPAAAGPMLDGIVRGTELSARTRLPFRDFAMVNFRWGIRVPPSVEDLDTVVVEGKRSDWWSGIRLPHLVINKVAIEHVGQTSKTGEKVGSGGKYGDVAGACLDVKKKLEVIQAENGLLSNALSDLRSDVAAGKMNLLAEGENGFGAVAVDRRSDGDKKSLEGKGFGGEGKEETKGAY